jgi:O-antigen ligase
VVWTALGVSHVDVLNIPIARAVRWGMLCTLLALSIAYAVSARPRRYPVSVALAAASLCAIATLSALWSGSPTLTLGRALSFDALVVAGLCLAAGTDGRRREVGQVLLALLAGAAIVAAGGVLALALGDERSYQAATLGTPVRFNGLGGNPNAMALLLALALPLAAWALFEARSRAGKAAAALVFVLLDVSMATSGSRGAILASFAGLVTFGALLPGTRARHGLVVGASVALLLVNIGVTRIPQNADRNPVINQEFGTPTPIAPADAEFILPLNSEIGWDLRNTPRVRGFFESSGRVQAWRSGVEQWADRPLLGYGFGTEERAFVDRLYLFVGSQLENSYLGTLLQLGAVGLGVFLALLVLIARAGRRAVASAAGGTAAACAAVAVGAAFLAAGQSFLTSVGNAATATAWLCALLLAGLGGRAPRRGEEGEQRLGDEEEEEAAQRHPEPRLDVVRADHDGVRQ